MVVLFYYHLKGVLHADPTEKDNILNRQFQSAFSSEANTEILDKSPSTHPIMKNISISKKDILKLVWKCIFEPFIHILQHFVLQLSRSTNFCF
jgi:hypothetical protein